MKHGDPFQVVPASECDPEALYDLIGEAWRDHSPIDLGESCRQGRIAHSTYERKGLMRRTFAATIRALAACGHDMSILLGNEMVANRVHCTCRQCIAPILHILGCEDPRETVEEAGTRLRKAAAELVAVLFPWEHPMIGDEAF
ncbi:MAG: hypothetical protein PVG25_04640 [Anaerolineae bacterium]|jgi:hypothetical protein